MPPASPHFCSSTSPRPKEIDYRNGYIQIHLTLSGLPEFTGPMSYINEGDMRWIASYIPSPEYLARCWEQDRKGEIPDRPVSYYHIPSLIDPSAAPEGYRACTFFSRYFPHDVPQGRHREMAEGMADRVLGDLEGVVPPHDSGSMRLGAGSLATQGDGRCSPATTSPEKRKTRVVDGARRSPVN